MHRQVEAQAPATDRRARRSRRRGAIVLTRNERESIALANRLAPEHLVVDDAATAARMTTAGTIFVGAWSAQAAGDYATGSNHVLPTSGAARFRGGLSAADFVRVSSVQTLTRAALTALAPTDRHPRRRRGPEGARAVDQGADGIAALQRRGLI